MADSPNSAPLYPATSPSPSRTVGSPPFSSHAVGSPPEIAVFLVDASGSIASWSPGAAAVTGYTAAEVVGRDVALLYTPEAREDGQAESELARATKEGRAECEIWIQQKSGTRVWTETLFTALRDERGVLSAFVCHTRDLSEQKASEARRRARADQLAALAATRQDVATYGLEIAALLPRLAMRARQLTGADAAVLELKEGGTDRPHAHDGLEDFDVKLTKLLVPHGGATSGARLKCIRYDDRHESPEILADVADRLGIGSVLAIPILHDRATIGWLAVLARGPRAFGDAQVATLEMMATLVGGPVAQAQASESRRALLAERARAQAAHRESEARFRAAMDASLDALFIIGAVRDRRGAIVDFALLDANRRAEELCTLPHESYAGQCLAALPSVARQLARVSVLAHVVETRAPVEQERQSTDGTGRVRWIQEQIVPLEDGVTVTVRDVTARVETDAEMRRAREVAEAANRAKTEFVAKMSHELRTPLNSIIGFANILLRNKRKSLDEKELAYLGRVSSAGAHLLALINDVLDIAKVEAGHMSLELALVDVIALARTTLAQMDTHAHAAGLSISLESTASSLVVEADAGKLQQVLLNLVGNAIKFTPAGSVTMRITAGEPDVDGDDVAPCIEIVDTGIGISADRLAAVFEAFEQAESSTSRRYGGTGLGLSISRALCEAMGFSLGVASLLGVGTTFRIQLSRASVVDSALQLSS